MPRLLIKHGSNKPYEVRITRFPFRVGREPDNDLVLTDDGISGYHFRLRRQGEAVTLDDLDSRNGTFHGKPPQRIRSVVLADNDRFAVGRQTHIMYRADAARRQTANMQRQSVVVQDLTNLTKQVDNVVTRIDVIREGRQQRTGASGSLDELSRDIASAQSQIGRVAHAYERLSALYDATGYIIAGVADLDQCLRQVLGSAIDVLQAERGFVMLRDAESGDLQVRVSRDVNLGREEEHASMGIAEQVARTGEPVCTANAGEDFSERDSVILQQIRSVLCVPLQLELGDEKRDIGVLYLDTRDPDNVFNPEDQELLVAFGRLAAIAIENARLFTRVQEEERMRNQMARYLPRAVVEKRIDEGDSWEPGGKECPVTILASDIRGFTTLSEHMSPGQVMELLNYYFTEMTELIFAHEGTLDKFIGDGIMAIFGAPYSRDDDAMRAVACAIEMVEQMGPINAELKRRGLPELRIGIGLNSGIAIAGNVGSARRMDYTVVGDIVNTAFRLTGEAKPDADAGEAGQILVAESTYNLISPVIQAEAIGERLFKGKTTPQPVYRVDVAQGSGVFSAVGTAPIAEE